MSVSSAYAWKFPRSNINDSPTSTTLLLTFPLETGAVFTLGRSHLSDDHQHFFFIKNDPVERLRCGYNESAAICKSGRCFVW